MVGLLAAEPHDSVAVLNLVFGSGGYPLLAVESPSFQSLDGLTMSAL